MREFAYIHDEGALSETLLSVPFLKSFEKEHLDDVLYSSSIVECEPGDQVIEEGACGSRIYILLAGVVGIYKAGERLATLRNIGDIFGELAALGDEMRSATVRAESKTFLLAIDQKFLHDVKPRKKNPSFYAAFYEFLARITATRLKSTSEELSRVERQLAHTQEQLSALKESLESQPAS